MEHRLEALIFRSRWLLAPFFIGLILAVISLLVEFVIKLFALLRNVLTPTESDTIVAILSLVDITLIASLLLIIIFSGYENFVSKIDVGEHVDRPAWMGRVGFSDLKIKLIGAIVAISAVELLKAFIDLDKFTDQQIAWKVGIHLTFVFSGVLFALSDRIAEGKGKGH